MKKLNEAKSSYSASFDADARKAGKSRDIDIVYDFTDVTDDEKHELALKTLNIRHKSWMLSMATDDEHFLEMDIDPNVSVRMLLDRAKTRESLSPEQQVDRNVAKITDAEKLADTIAKMEARLKALQS